MIFSKDNAGKWVASKGGKVIAATGKRSSDARAVIRELQVFSKKHRGKLLSISAFAISSSEQPTVEQLLDWLPDRWLLNRTRGTTSPAVAAT